MNTGQMLTVVFALVLLGVVTLVINQMLADKAQVMLQAEASLTAISLGQTMLDEIKTKSYDAVTAPSGSIYPPDGGTKVYDSSAFTSPSGLGPSGTESHNVPLPESPDTVYPFKSIQNYNDVDDYNHYSRYVYSSVLGTFFITDTVYYVIESSPDMQSTTQTFFKKIVVTITHPNMSYPLQLSDIAVYRRYF